MNGKRKLPYGEKPFQMNRDHWILLGAWGLFGLIHSMMAGKKVKNVCQTRMGDWYKYYRLAYSFMALLSLGVVLVWQFFIKSAAVGQFPLLKLLAGIPAALIGIFLMGVSIHKYFFNLSGIAVFRGENSGEILETAGMHRYVRHPLYLGTLLLIWALFLFFPQLANLLACIMITIYTLIGIRLEERKLLQEFGADYVRYCRATPMLVPRIGATPKEEG
jgi:methanethiol S-methyltransferase